MKASEVENLIRLTEVLTRNDFRLLLGIILFCIDGFTKESVAAIGRHVGLSQQAASRSFANLTEKGAVTRDSGIITLPCSDLAHLVLYTSINLKTKRAESHDIYVPVVDLWNGIGLRPWRKALTKRQRGLIDAYGVDVVMAAIRVYAEVLYGEEYYYTAKISFDNFLEKKVDNFASKDLYLKWQYRQKAERDAKWLEAVKS